MRKIFFGIVILSCTFAMATSADSTLGRHAFSISMANGFSQQFFEGPNHHLSNSWGLIQALENTPPRYMPPPTTYLPMYTVHVQLHYSLGLTHFLRLETGIGYLLSGSTLNPSGVPGSSFATYVYYGAITLPLYIKVNVPMRRGAFTCMLGPDFCLPMHGFNKANSESLEGEESPYVNGHARYTTYQTEQASSMGVYLKMGYEKRLHGSLPLTINIGPVVDFNQLVMFHTLDNEASSYGYHPYQFYAGLDVSLTFGLKR